MTYPCPICGSGTVTTIVETNYATKVRGCDFIVAKANVERCDKCGEGFFSAKELKSWRDAFYKSLSDAAKVRILGADGDGFLDGTSRADATLIKRGLLANIDGLVVLTNTGIKVRQGLLQ
jgi:YgiT-type zinc finger domain-containing protein